MRWLAIFSALLWAQAQTQQPVFRSTTDHVTTHVTARDASGRFVPDLTSNEFEVYEDGVRQQVTTFSPVIGGRALASAAPASPGPPRDSRGEGLIIPPRSPRDLPGRIFIVFIDDLHLQALDTPKVRDVLKQIRDRVLQDHDLVGIVSSGFSSIAQDLAYDYGHRRFNAALTKVMGSGLSPADLLQAAQTAQGPAEVRYRAHAAFRLAHDLLGQAEKITDRRKSFLYVSNGYDFNPFKDSRYRHYQDQFARPDKTASGIPDSVGAGAREPIPDNPFDRDGNQFSESDLVADVAELVNAARRANVVFYAIDPRGLDAGPPISASVTAQEWREFMQVSQSSLRVLGDETGGFCICNTNEFGRNLDRINNETSDYYVIGYTSNNPDPQKRRRAIEIKTTRPDVELIYRTEYTLPRVKR